MDWAEVVTFCLSSKCIPTILFYEAKPPLLKTQTIEDFDRFAITQDIHDTL
jgi:hypothetical protein